MKLFELAEELGIKESYLKSHWALIVRRYDKYGIILAKRGRGSIADFGIKNFGDKDIRWEKK